MQVARTLAAVLNAWCVLHFHACMPDVSAQQADICTQASRTVLHCREEYFGLRVRKTEDPTQAINIPVNITVGTSGVLPSISYCLHVQRLGWFCLTDVAPYFLHAQRLGRDRLEGSLCTRCMFKSLTMTD